MGIHLDWEIEAEQQQVRQAGEDPQSARKRRRARLKVLLIILLVLGVFAGVVVGVFWRLRTVDEQVEQALRNTVEAEVTALRIGDENAFLSVQRSATDDWQIAQQALFDAYQSLKLQRDVRLTGRVVDATVNGLRGRVQVEEIIDSVPYSRVWFYWRYDDGWRHVPPDYTFWGDVKTATGQGVSVRYNSVDDALAQDVRQKIENWLKIGCEALTCGTLPDVAVEIVPDESLPLAWSDSNPWQMQFPSPYTRQARLDMPFDLNLQLQVAGLLGERLVAMSSNDMQPTYPADAYYLRSAVGSWLVGRFAQIDTNSFLVASLAQNYGGQAVGRLLQAMTPDANAGILNTVTSAASLELANLDWRDFFTWRLALENELVTRRDETNFLALYDTRDETVRNAAYTRYNAGASGEQRIVVSTIPETAPDGSFILRAIVQIGGGRQEAVLFRVVDGGWRRAN
jgi:hypothetical protein